MVKPVENSSDFAVVILESIDSALSVYGEKIRLGVFDYLERALGISKSEIPARIDEFSAALEDLFDIGAKNIEILIMERLHSLVGVVWEWKPSTPWFLPDLTFREYVNFVKKYIEDNQDYEKKATIFISEKEALKVYK